MRSHWGSGISRANATPIRTTSHSTSLEFLREKGIRDFNLRIMLGLVLTFSRINRETETFSSAGRVYDGWCMICGNYSSNLYGVGLNPEAPVTLPSAKPEFRERIPRLDDSQDLLCLPGLLSRRHRQANTLFYQFFQGY